MGVAVEDFAHEYIEVNSITLHVVSAGPLDGAPVVFCHGFPETWYSWRHQMRELAALGYRVLALDWRGYGSSSVPRDVEGYGSDTLSKDLCALLDHFDYEAATFVGHDWGAIVLWDMARLHPTRVNALFNMSVPLTVSPGPPLEFFDAVFADQFFYINYFQSPGIAESELEPNLRAFLRNFLYSASGEGMSGGLAFAPASREGTGLLDTLASAPSPLPSWLNEDDVDEYVTAFEQSGLVGPLSFYRNMDNNWRATKDISLDTLSMPIGFLTGELDPVRFLTGQAADAMADLFADFRGVQVIEGAGHWIQQERADETNRILTEFLQSVR